MENLKIEDFEKDFEDLQKILDQEIPKLEKAAMEIEAEIPKIEAMFQKLEEDLGRPDAQDIWDLMKKPMPWGSDLQEWLNENK